ncbi:MAG TPA: PAS domain-containing protein [Nevskiaceae bacterium]|nr:PAS domain-containing protein [Nevskiaceae bacterium]
MNVPALFDLAAQSPLLIALVDREGRVIEGNRTFSPLLAAGFAESSRARIEQAIATVAREGVTLQLDAPMLRESGAPVWRLIVLSPAGPDGRSDEIFAHVIDIDDRKREEDRLRRSEALLVDTQGVAHLGVWDWDVTQPHASWSPELFRIYALDPRTHVPTYQDYLTRVHPDDRQRVIDATNAAFHDHEPYSHDERIYRSDGALRYLHTWAYPVVDASGKLLRLTGVCQDITDRKLAENAVIEHATLLERANADLEQFARHAAHDLQEPLRTIASFVQILAMNLEGKLDPSSKQAMEFIEQAARRMKDQIGELRRRHLATPADR